MKTEELAKLGIHLDKRNPKKRLFYVEGLDLFLKIPDHSTMADIYKMIFEKGKEKGIRLGEQTKIAQIKKVLEIEDEH